MFDEDRLEQLREYSLRACSRQPSPEVAERLRTEALAHAVDGALDSALEEMARELVLEVGEVEEVSTDSPILLSEAIYQTTQFLGEFWDDVADAAANFAATGDRRKLDESVYLAKHLTEVAQLLLDKLDAVAPEVQ